MAKQKYAHIKSKNISAINNGLFVFNDIDSALKKIEEIKSYYTVSSKTEIYDDSSILLWIFEYGLTTDEKKEGYMGNFGRIYVEQLNLGKYTLKLEKIPEELKFHPRRKRRKHRLPNWGHPVLRAVKKKKKYNSEKDAGKELRQLLEEFPEVSIPAHNMLYIMVYSREYEGNTRKIILEIKHIDDCYIIQQKENPRQERLFRNKIYEVFDSCSAYIL